MPALQLQIDGKRRPEEYEDFVKADKALRALVKAGKLPDTADIRIVPALKLVAPETLASPNVLPVSEKIVIVREKFVRAPHHNTVMTACILFGMLLGWSLRYVV